jgi:DNA-binding IclR family transcriptional regulator
MTEPFSELVRQLLREHMTSFERLEVLLFLHKHGAEPLSPQDIGNQLGMPPELVLEATAGLEASRLAQRQGDARFRFAPATPALANAVEELAVAYREQSAAVMSAMSMYAIERIRSGPMRAFADSFLLGKRKDNG